MDFYFILFFFKFQLKSTFTLKSYKVWKLSNSTVSQCCCCHQSRLRELVILTFKSKHLKLKCSTFCATFYTTRPSESHSKALIDMIAPSSLVFPLFTLSSACFHLLFVQLVYSILMAKPGGFLLIVALKSVYMDKRKKKSVKKMMLCEWWIFIEERRTHTRVKYDKPKHQMKQMKSDKEKVLSRERSFIIPLPSAAHMGGWERLHHFFSQRFPQWHLCTRLYCYCV